MKIRNSIVAALALLFATLSAPGQPLKGYIPTHFTRDNGLLANVVHWLVQSQDGFLWMTTGDFGVVRFDGQHFTTLPIGRVSGPMTLGPNGDLWISAETGLTQIPAARLNQFGPLEAIQHPSGLPPNTQFTNLLFSRSGVLWVIGKGGSSYGLYRFEHGGFTCVVPGLDILRIEEAANGNLLMSTSQGFIEWDGSRAVPHPEVAGELDVRPEEIFQVFEDSHGATWFCTAKGLARRIGNSLEKIQPWGAKENAALRIYEDPQGNVWIATPGAVCLATSAGLEVAVPDIKPRYIYRDPEGNLWIGTNGDGLFRFKNRAVQMFTKADGLPSNLPMTVLTTHDGVLWAGFNCGGLVRFDGHTFRTYDEKDGLLNSCVYSLAEDVNHDLWIGTYGGGMFRFHDSSFTQYSKAQGLPSDTVSTIIAARDGSLWFTSQNGLSRLRDGQVRNYTIADGLSSHEIPSIYEDRSGGIWVGTTQGLDHLEGDRFLKIPAVPNIPSYVVGEDHAGALYLRLIGKGLLRLDHGQLSEVTKALDGIYMIEIEQGDVWLNGGDIARIPRAGLERPRGHDEPLDFTIFGLSDGLISSEGSAGYPNAAVTRDGKLWLATVQGLAMFDLPHLRKLDRKPSIYMKEITVGRNQQFPGQELVLPAGTHHVELRFDAVEITAPEKILMQYRMDDVDSEWLDAAPPGHATYTNIPVGTHAFHVRACNRDGVWDRVGMVYFITQQPYFYQTRWFRAAMITLAIMLVFFIYRLRVAQISRMLSARFDERLAERTRVARELHDTLLQTVQGSKMVADHALKNSGDQTRMVRAMEQLSTWLAQATEEGRAALLSLRSSTTEKNDLAQAFQRAIDECGRASKAAASFSVNGNPREMHPVVRDEVYRIGYEAIRNSCAHSGADRLEVTLDYAHDLTLRIGDNGAGIDSEVVEKGKDGHFGLRGMRERAERIGSKLTIASSAESGTVITLVVPGRVAFRPARSEEDISVMVQ